MRHMSEMPLFGAVELDRTSPRKKSIILACSGCRPCSGYCRWPARQKRHQHHAAIITLRVKQVKVGNAHVPVVVDEVQTSASRPLAKSSVVHTSTLVPVGRPAAKGPLPPDSRVVCRLHFVGQQKRACLRQSGHFCSAQGWRSGCFLSMNVSLWVGNRCGRKMAARPRQEECMAHVHHGV